LLIWNAVWLIKCHDASAAYAIAVFRRTAVATRGGLAVRRARFSVGHPEAASAGSSSVMVAPIAQTVLMKSVPVFIARCRHSDVTTVIFVYQGPEYATAIAIVLVAKMRLVATIGEVGISVFFTFFFKVFINNTEI